VRLLAPSTEGPSGDALDGPLPIRRVRTVPVPFGYKLRVAPLAMHETSAWMDAFQPEVVHIHHPFPLSAAALLAARKRGIPIVATNHTIPECSLFGLRHLPVVYPMADAILAWWILRILAGCRRVAVPSATAARLLEARGFRSPLTVISNGVDTARFSPGEPNATLRAELGFDERPIVLYTGRLDAEKQMGVWLSAAACLSQRLDVQFAVGGEGADRHKLEKLACRLGLGGRLRFVGYLSDQLLPEVYRLASVYFITSPVELQSISTLEAMASGVPVVAVRAGALPELVHDGRNGFVVQPGEWRAAAVQLQVILMDASKRGKMASESRAIARQHDIERSIDRYEEFLLSVLTDQRGDETGDRAAAAGR
jgi:glycosyltransferase involved in cell wall biosynthesis